MRVLPTFEFAVWNETHVSKSFFYEEAKNSSTHFFIGNFVEYKIKNVALPFDEEAMGEFQCAFFFYTVK